MSYNITTSKVKVLKDLVIPITAFFEHERKDWHPTSSVHVDGDGQMIGTLNCGCEQTIVGVLKDGNIHVTGMDLAGEGSGTFLSWILEPALKKSTGQFTATLIWEGGDDITQITVDNGELEEKQIEI